MKRVRVAGNRISEERRSPDDARRVDAQRDVRGLAAVDAPATTRCVLHGDLALALLHEDDRRRHATMIATMAEHEQLELAVLMSV